MATLLSPIPPKQSHLPVSHKHKATAKIDLCYNTQFNMTAPIFSDEMIRVYLT
ncbi:hypothetical protein AO381_1844 [Moraxella catarrhalis]|nr:hypothetical protein AO381_1844 [Moraxella catarrhalis]